MSTRHMSLLPPYERLRWRPDVDPHLLRTWRHQVREGRFVAAPPARFMPVRVATTAPAAVGIAPPSQPPAAAANSQVRAAGRPNRTPITTCG